MSFLAKHSKFLNLVRHHGQGNIGFTRRNDKMAEIFIENNAKRNSLSGRMMYQLAEIADDLFDMSNMAKLPLCLMIRSEGADTFSSGADLGLVSELVNTPERGAMMSSYMTEVLNAIRDSPMISVCCLNGTAVGGGSELATVGDFRLMTNSNPSKHFIQFIHAKLGATPGWGGTGRLVSIVGRKEAIRMCAGSQRITALEGSKNGFIDEIVTAHTSEEWYSAAEKYLDPYLSQPYPKSVQGIKHVIATAASSAASQHTIEEVETKVFADRWYSEEHAKHMASVMKK